MAKIRPFARFVWRSVKAHTVVLAGFTATSLMMNDPAHKLAVVRSTVVELQPAPWHAVAPKQKLRYLAADERHCVEAMVSLLSFDLHPAVFRRLTSSVSIDDPLIRLQGVEALRDAWCFLSHFARSAAPEVRSITRSCDDPRKLMIDLSTTVVLRGIGATYVWPSSVTIDLDKGQDGTGLSRVSRMEHRWYRGTINGTPSFPKLWASPFADGIRAFNGFVLSIIATYTPEEHSR
jgi:hypothetical protein